MCYLVAICRRPLFQTFFPIDDEITCGQVDALGILPSEWWRRWKARGEYFNDDGTPFEQRKEDAWSLDICFERSTQEPRREEGMMPFGQDEKEALFVMLRAMLAYKPEDRITIAGVLRSEWMTKWAMPEYEKVRPMDDPCALTHCLHLELPSTMLYWMDPFRESILARSVRLGGLDCCSRDIPFTEAFWDFRRVIGTRSFQLVPVRCSA